MRPLLYAAILMTLTAPAIAADNTVLNCEQVGNGSLYCYPAAEAPSQQVPGQSDTRRVVVQTNSRALDRALARIRTEVAPAPAPPPEPQTAYHPDPAIVPPLPTPDLADDTPPSGYLRAAAHALDAGDAAVAMTSMEMAETRLLDRSVPLGGTDVPAQSRVIREISAARAALQAGDPDRCARALDGAIGIAERHRM